MVVQSPPDELTAAEKEAVRERVEEILSGVTDREWVRFDQRLRCRHRRAENRSMQTLTRRIPIKVCLDCGERL
jgi:hypothetical protein